MYLFKLVYLFLLDIYRGVELLGHMVVLFLVFWETSILFSTVAAPICIPTNSAQEFPFLHILLYSCYLCSFWWDPFWQMWVDISLWFLFGFPWWLVMLSIFSCVCCLSTFPLWKNMSIQFFCQFSNQVVCFLMLNHMRCLNMLAINPLSIISFAHYHAPWLQTIIESYSNQNSMVLAQKEAHRWMEQDREARNKPTHLWSINLWQRRKECKMKKRQSLQLVVLGKLGRSM